MEKDTVKKEASLISGNLFVSVTALSTNAKNSDIGKRILWFREEVNPRFVLLPWLNAKHAST